MRYVIRLDETGYIGDIPFKGMPLEQATVFPTMKDARRRLNFYRGRMHCDKDEIEKLEEVKTA